MNQTETPVAPPAAQRQDARDLLALLYREIGISAVAAALQVSIDVERRGAPMPKADPLPDVLRGNDIAA